MGFGSLDELVKAAVLEDDSRDTDTAVLLKEAEAVASVLEAGVEDPLPVQRAIEQLGEPLARVHPKLAREVKARQVIKAAATPSLAAEGIVELVPNGVMAFGAGTGVPSGMIYDQVVEATS